MISGCEDEDARTQARRRFQQKKCLVCGARRLANRSTSYFCAAHISTHRYCSQCETLRTLDAHGRDHRCRDCAASKALDYYHRDPDRNIYRIRLKQLAQRTTTRGDQIMEAVRRRIALAALVARTPGMSWSERAAIVGKNATQLADQYRRQCRGDVRDVDAADRARDEHWRGV